MLKNYLAHARRTMTHEGGKAYELTPQEQVLRLFTIGQINGSFYEDTDQVIQAADATLRMALRDMPEFASRAAVYAAEQFGMKALPVLWSVYLSTLPDKTLFERVFPRVVTNPKLAHDFLTLARKGGIRQGMGQGVKRVVNRWLAENLNPVWTTRYAGKLEDVVRVTRPKDTEATRAYLQYILRPPTIEDGKFQGYGGRRLTFSRARTLVQVLADLAANRVTPETLAGIRAERLQLEELKHAFGNLDPDAKQAVFLEMVPTLRYAALVSNLVTIERAFATATRTEWVFQAGQRYQQERVVAQAVPGELVQTVTRQLLDLAAYRRSRMLPFALITAAEMTSVPEWRGALSETLQALGADAGLGDLGAGRTLIGVDCSGSMDSLVTRSLSARTVASTFAAMVAMALPGSRVYAVSATAVPAPVDQGARLLDNARRIAERVDPHYTYLGSLLTAYQGEETVLLITDSQTADNPEDLWAALRNRPEGARLIVWDVVAYNNRISNRPDVFYVQGYSDRVLGLVKSLIQGTGTQMAGVRAIQL